MHLPFQARKRQSLAAVDALDEDTLGAYRKRQLLSVLETARLLGLSPHLVRSRIRHRDPLFPFIKIGRRVLIKRAGVFAAFGLD
ncbi:MAG: hypothetical protein IAI50_16100 [Candidatus Eremiobacteraeota bacterium]|nr:hypothetical protein [Candidatus Eremiobacteraeota bacterium]